MMTRRSLAVLCAGLLAAANRPAFAGSEVAALVQKVQQRYDETKDFTAVLTQEISVASLGKTMTSRGTIAFKKPGKLRLELTGSDPQTVVADGTTLWLYQPRDRQVLKAPFDAAFHSSTPISFLTGVGRITDDFDASLDGENPTSHELYLKLVPRRDAGEVGRMRLTVDPVSFDIRGAEILDPLGNVSRLRFDDLRRNGGVVDSEFVFQPPPGVDVITAPTAQ